jgi:hypothetical protein
MMTKVQKWLPEENIFVDATLCRIGVSMDKTADKV